MEEFERYQLNAVFSENVHEYCHQSAKYDFIEVTEWKNGEGFDVNFSTRKTQEQKFSMTYGEYKLLKKLIEELRK